MNNRDDTAVLRLTLCGELACPNCRGTGKTSRAPHIAGVVIVVTVCTCAQMEENTDG